MRKDRFMQQINSSHEGGLTCSFNDYQLAEFIQILQRRSGALPIKKAVEHVGIQDDGTWIFGPDRFFDGSGRLQDPSESQYAWIGNMYEGPGIAHASAACSIPLPLSVNPLVDLYTWLEINMQHNFVPSMLVMGSCLLAFHYKKMIQTLLFCPIPIVYGANSGTGKTTALMVGLSPTGAYPTRFISEATYQKYTQMCASSYLPLGIDDPKSKTAVSDLVVALFNGAKAATIKHGEKTPTSLAVISANFTTIHQEKYAINLLLCNNMY